MAPHARMMPGEPAWALPRQRLRHAVLCASCGWNRSSRPRCSIDLTAFAVTAVAAAAAAALLMDTRYVGVVVLKDITAAQRQMLAGGLCIATVTLSGAVGAASTGACVGAAACAVHGATYEPSPDFS